jgi:hypothetical protein
MTRPSFVRPAGAGADAEVHAPGIDMSELDQYDKAYLEAVRDHLGPWWAPARLAS